MRIFYGNNGGVFFFSRESWASWRLSLEFYKGVSWQAKAKRLALLLAYPVLRDNCSLEEMSEMITTATGVSPELVPSCGGIISPTGDKSVVHISGQGYWKAATGKSYAGVKNEAEIYRLFAEKKPRKFGCSEIRDFRDDGKTVSFWMSEEEGAFCGDTVKPLEAVLPALEEFHDLKPEGLVHGDFKPWNVRWRKDGRPHFFDFEECHGGEIQEDIDYYRTWGGLKR